jgi:DNA adenine methylase
MNAPERPILRYHGGKFRLAPRIIAHFPPHRVYVEPFGGAGSVLMRKEPSFAEVYNDLDGEVVNVFRVLRDPDRAERLRTLLELTPWSRIEFRACYEPADDPIEQARRTIACSFMAHGSTSIRLNRTGFRNPAAVAAGRPLFARAAE